MNPSFPAAYICGCRRSLLEEGICTVELIIKNASIAAGMLCPALSYADTAATYFAE
jgi:hypothetical protein